MADHRKSFRPRRLAFDGRLLSRGSLLGAALALLCALTPAQAQDTGLKSGAASLNSGNYNAAVRQLSAAVNDRNSSKGQAAKALYLRGLAYRKLSKPGRAISDLGAAIWLGLPPDDKVRALVNKGLAYKSAGLSSHGDTEFARARSASSSSKVDRLIAENGGGGVTGSSVEVSSGIPRESDSIWTRWIPSFGGEATPRPTGAPTPTPTPTPTPSPAAAPEPAPTKTAAAPTSGWGASVSDGEAKESSSGVSGWFKSLTGDSASTTIAVAPATTPPPPKKTSTAPKRTVAPPTAASWAANTETQKVASKSSGSGLGRWFGGGSSSPSSAPAAAPAGKGYQVQFANSRSQADAKALWKQVQAKNSQLASVQPRIEKVDIGSFGTFYSLKVGPYASQSQSTKVCNALKRNGTDCSIISPDGP